MIKILSLSVDTYEKENIDNWGKESCAYENNRISLICVKSMRIRNYSGPHFPAFGLNTERYGVSLRIQSECRENAEQNNSE